VRGAEGAGGGGGEGRNQGTYTCMRVIKAALYLQAGNAYFCHVIKQQAPQQCSGAQPTPYAMSPCLPSLNPPLACCGGCPALPCPALPHRAVFLLQRDLFSGAPEQQPALHAALRPLGSAVMESAASYYAAAAERQRSKQLELSSSLGSVPPAINVRVAFKVRRLAAGLHGSRPVRVGWGWGQLVLQGGSGDCLDDWDPSHALPSDIAAAGSPLPHVMMHESAT
jgi:hypothetical protein